MGGSFLHYFTILAATMGAAIRWRYVGGFLTLVLTSLLTWQFFNPNLVWTALFLFGASLTYIGTKLNDSLGNGEGRLAWQRSPIGTHQMLWHNGMVGGSASFLGIVQELKGMA